MRQKREGGKALGAEKRREGSESSSPGEELRPSAREKRNNCFQSKQELGTDISEKRGRGGEPVQKQTQPLRIKKGRARFLGQGKKGGGRGREGLFARRGGRKSSFPGMIASKRGSAVVEESEKMRRIFEIGESDSVKFPNSFPGGKGVELSAKKGNQ